MVIIRFLCYDFYIQIQIKIKNSYSFNSSSSFSSTISCKIINEIKIKKWNLKSRIIKEFPVKLFISLEAELEMLKLVQMGIFMLHLRIQVE